MKALFIGGVADGKVMEVGGEHFHEIPVPTPLGSGKFDPDDKTALPKCHRYRRQRFRDQYGAEHSAMVFEGFHGDMMKLLLDSYAEGQDARAQLRAIFQEMQHDAKLRSLIHNAMMKNPNLFKKPCG